MSTDIEIVLFPLVLKVPDRTKIAPEVDHAMLAYLMNFRKIVSEARVWRDLTHIETAPLTTEQIIEWRTLYPHQWRDSEFPDYDVGVIPPPVLEKFINVFDSGAFEHYEIWENAETKNQLLIAVRDNTEHYILAAWGPGTNHSFEKIGEGLSAQGLVLKPTH